MTGRYGILAGLVIGVCASLGQVIAERMDGYYVILPVLGLLVGMILGFYRFWTDEVYTSHLYFYQFMSWVLVGFGMGWVIPPLVLLPDVSYEMLAITALVPVGMVLVIQAVAGLEACLCRWRYGS